MHTEVVIHIQCRDIGINLKCHIPSSMKTKRDQPVREPNGLHCNPATAR